MQLNLWRLLYFLLKSVSDNYQIIFIEEGKDTKYVAATLNPDFIDSISPFNMFEINFRNPVEVFYNF